MTKQSNIKEKVYKTTDW